MSPERRKRRGRLDADQDVTVTVPLLSTTPAAEFSNDFNSRNAARASFDMEEDPELTLKDSAASSPPDRASYDASGSPDRPKDALNQSSLGGLTLLEKKYVVINDAIDKMGMGRYQWCIWGLCGFGYFLDLLWAQAFGLALSPLGQEFGFDSARSGEISTSFSAGLTAGAAFWGILVDIVGRRWAFNLTVLFSSAFGLGLGGANSYTTFLVLTAFVGFGVGGNVPIDTTITLEFIPQRSRHLLPFLSIFQPIGVVVCTAIAYGFIPTYSCKPDWTQEDALPSCILSPPGTEPPDCCGRSNNMGWRYTLFTLGGLTLLAFFLRFIVFRFRESPKFLVYRGRDEKAAEVLQKIAKFNKTECNVTLQTFEDLTNEYDSVNSDVPMLEGGKRQLRSTWKQKASFELDRYKMLFSSAQMARLTLLVWLTYFCDYWGFTLAGTYLPKILSLKNSDINLSTKYTYRSYIYIYLPGIAGVLLGVLCYNLPVLGRKWTMVLSSGLMGASLFIFATVNDEASNIGVNVMEYFFQSMFNSVLYGWTPEVFAAPVRGTASGAAAFWGRLAGIVAPLAGQSLAPPASAPASEFDKLLYLAGGVTMACVVWTALLPGKMVGKDSM